MPPQSMTVLERSQDLVFPRKAREGRGNTLGQTTLLQKETEASAAETWVRTRRILMEPGSERFLRPITAHRKLRDNRTFWSLLTA